MSSFSLLAIGMKKTIQQVRKRIVKKQNSKKRGKLQIPFRKAMDADAETLFIRYLMESDYCYDVNPISRYLLYNATPSTKKLVYGFGHHLGIRMHQESGSSRNLLPALSEKIGIGKTLYIPSEETLIIKSSPRVTINSGIFAHIMEAGIISGYLSSFTGEKVATRETACSFNGDWLCKFESYASNTDPDFSDKLAEISKISKSALSDISDTRAPTNGYYAILSMIPMLSAPLSTELSKLLYLAGSMAAEHSEKGNERGALSRISYFLDLENTFFEKKGVRASIILKDKPYNSNIPFIDLSASMFAGFASSMFGREIAVESAVDNNRNYLVKLSTARRI